MEKDPVQILITIREQFKTNTRPMPSSYLISNGNLLNEDTRRRLLDYCAALTDKNPTGTGRSDMCIYFSCLLRYALRLMGYKAEVLIGNATFRENNKEFSWEHSWVEYNDILIDGNADSMRENPYVPDGISPHSYWGEKQFIPSTREYNSKRILLASDELDELDDDYLEWKREIKRYLKQENIK